MAAASPPSLKFKRRTVIGLTVAATAAGCMPSAPSEPKALAAKYVPVWRKVARALLAIPQSGLIDLDEQFESRVESIVKHLSPSLTQNLFLALEVFDRASFVYGLHFSAFRNLETEAASRYCQSWFEGNSIQREAIGALAQISLTAYWRNEETWPAVGYTGPTSAAYGVASLGVSPMPVNESAVDSRQSPLDEGVHDE